MEIKDLFAEEPPNGTHLVLWEDCRQTRVIWRDDVEAKRWGGHPDEHWFEDTDSDPMGLDQYLRNADRVHAVVPLDRSGLNLAEEC